MKEIGGYFGLEQLVNDEYYKELVPLNNARNALIYLLKAKCIKKLYIPYYLCNSVSDTLGKNGYAFEYYKVNSEFKVIFDNTLAADEYLYIVNYYGQLTERDIAALKKQYMQVIIDNSQAFFQKPIENVDTIYSCRKFFGVPDGAYVSTDIKLEEELSIDVSKERMTHILGRYEGTASEYYKYFLENDFKNEPLKYMSKLTHNILGAIDYQKVRKIRNENYAYLEDKLGEYNKLKLKAPDGAFAYPFYVRDGPEIRKVMAQRGIYIPTLWPNVINNTSEESTEYKYAANILPLPCDQRYGAEEMDYLIESLDIKLYI